MMKHIIHSRICESRGARWLIDWQHGYRPRSRKNYRQGVHSTQDIHDSSRMQVSGVHLWLWESNISNGLEDPPRKEKVLERAETRASHWPVLLVKQPVKSVEWSTATEQKQVWITEEGDTSTEMLMQDRLRKSLWRQVQRSPATPSRHQELSIIFVEPYSYVFFLLVKFPQVLSLFTKTPSSSWPFQQRVWLSFPWTYLGILLLLPCTRAHHHTGQDIFPRPATRV